MEHRIFKEKWAYRFLTKNSARMTSLPKIEMRENYVEMFDQISIFQLLKHRVPKKIQFFHVRIFNDHIYKHHALYPAVEPRLR